MPDKNFPDLPSDEELGIDGMDEEEWLDEQRGEPSDEAGEGSTQRQERKVKDGAGEPSEGQQKERAGGKEAPPKDPGRQGGRDQGGGPEDPDGPGPTGKGTGRPGSWFVGLATLVVLLAGGWMASVNRILPAPVAANAPDTAFSSARALSNLVELARAPRPVGSPEHTRARELVMGWLEELGLEPEIHHSVSVQRGVDGARAVTIRNVVARIPGQASTGAVVLTAHYDGVPLSHAAADAGFGIVAILETVRALQAGPPLDNDLIVLITDAEEIGLLGARAFVAEHRWMDDVAVVLSAEMRGGGGPVYMFETGADNGWVVQAMRAGDPRPLAGSLSVELYRRLPNDTDFTAFREVGIQGLNFAAIDRAEIYHQPTDIPANVEEATLQHMGMRLLGITRELGGRDLSVVDAPDLVYVTVPVLGILAYPQGLALPVSAAILLLWVATVVILRRAGAGFGGMALGLGVSLVGGGLTALGGWGMMQWLPRFHPEYRSLVPAFYGEGWYLLALVLTGAAVTVGLLGLARRFAGPASLAAGALFLPVLTAVAAALVVPLGALDVQIPALAGTLAVGALALGRGAGVRDHPAIWARVLVLVLSLGVLALMVPLVQGIHVAMGLHMVVPLAVLVGLGFACLIPALDGLGEPNRWWAPVAGLVAGGGLLGFGILQAGPSAERPVPSTLLHVVDREEDEAFWLTRDDPGLEWARERFGDFQEVRSGAPFLLPGSWLAQPVAVADAGEPVGVADGGEPVDTTEFPAPIVPEFPAPTVEVVETVPGMLARTLRLRVSSEVAAEVVTLELDHDEEFITVVAVNGARVPPGEAQRPGARRPVTRVTHQGVPRNGLLLDVEVPEALEALRVRVVEEHMRPAELLGAEPFQRPPHLMASSRNRSDRLVIRTPLEVAVPLEEPEEEVEEEPVAEPADEPPVEQPPEVPGA